MKGPALLLALTAACALNAPLSADPTPGEKKGTPPPQLPADFKALNAALRGQDPKARQTAWGELLNYPLWKLPAADAVPLLLAHLKTPGTDLQEINFQGLLMENLARAYGPKAKAALPVLLPLIVNDKVYFYLRGQAIWAAGRIGPGEPQVIDALVKAINNPNPKSTSGVHDRAAEALGEMGKAAWRARPALLFLLEHHFDIVQDSAFRALGRITLEQPAKAPAEYARRLDRLGKLPADQVAAAFLALQQVGDKERPAAAVVARPALVRVVEQRPNDIYSRAALRTLAILGPGSDPRTVKALLKDLLRPSPAGAAAVLEKVDGSDKDAVAPLTAALESLTGGVHWDRRVVVARALGRFGRSGAPATPALVKALRNVRKVTAITDAYSTELAAYLDALANVAPHQPKAVAAVLDLLDPGSQLLQSSGKLTLYVRTLLLRGLGKIGLPANADLRERAWARVREGLDAELPSLFVAATEAVVGAGKVSPEEAKPLVPHLMRVLRPGFAFKVKDAPGGLPPRPRVAAVQALGSLGAGARDALPVLEALAKRPLLRRGDFTPEPRENVVTRVARKAVEAIR